MRALIRSRAVLSLVGTAAILTLAGCSSSDDETPTTTSTVSSASDTSATGESSIAPSSTDATSVESTPSSSDAAPSTESPAAETAAPPAATEEPAPAATTPVEAPGGGNIDQTVAPVELTTAPAVPLTEPAQFGAGVTAELASLVKQTVEAQGPGEVTGPGLVVTIKITNGSSTAIPLDAVNVTLDDGNTNPASPMSGPPSAPFSGELAPGANASAVYVFAFPTDYKDPSTISVSYSTAAPILVFTGTLG